MKNRIKKIEQDVEAAEKALLALERKLQDPAFYDEHKHDNEVFKQYENRAAKFRGAAQGG